MTGRRWLLDEEAGAVFAEYLISFVVLFTVFLVIFQLQLAFEAKKAVWEAADYAASKAAKVLDAPSEEMGGAERNRVSGGGLAPNRVALALEALGFGSAGSGMIATVNGNARHQAIRDAARFKLLPFSPKLSDAGRGTNAQRARRLDDDGMRQRERYTRRAVAVVFPTREGATSYKSSFGKNELVRVRVTFLFSCDVPVASWILCRSVSGLVSGFGREGSKRLGVLDLKPRQGVAPFAHDLAYVTDPMGLASLRGRYLLLSAEAVRNNQGADYEYSE